MVRANRLSWEIYCGALDAAEHILRRCDNRICINPDHLIKGAQVVNVRDKVVKGLNRGESHGMVKLKGDEVLLIRANTTDSHRSIAITFGVSEQTICDIKARRTWKHLL